MDIRVKEAFDLMNNKGEYQAFLSQSQLGKSCLRFFRFMQEELLPELWLHARPLFSAQLLSLVQQHSRISFQNVICSYFDLIGEEQFCRRYGERYTVCVAPHIYPCFWRRRELDWLMRQGFQPPIQFCWSEEEILRGICDEVLSSSLINF